MRIRRPRCRCGPIYVLWWVAGDHVPTWREACERLEHLQDHGATAWAFDWKTPFDAGEQAYSVDRARIKLIAEQNRA